MRKTIIHLITGGLGLVVLVAILVIAIAVRPQGNAQTDSQPFKERLVSLGLPVKSVGVIKQTPLQYEVTLQSASSDGKLDHNDQWNRFLAERETDVAYLTLGIPIEAYRIVIESDKGMILYDSTVFLNPNLPSQNLKAAPPSALDDAKTKDVVAQNLNLHGLTLASLTIAPSFTAVTHNQLLTLEVSTNPVSNKTDSEQINAFVMSLNPQLKEINTRYGTRIVIVRAEIKDSEGKLLVDYMLDTELGKQSSWVADGIEGAWFSSPPPPRTPEAIVTTNPIETALPTLSPTPTSPGGVPLSTTPALYPLPQTPYP